MVKSELALKDKLFQSNFFNYYHSSDGFPDHPWVVELDPTTACNLACPDCISGTLLGQGGFSSDRLLFIGQELIDSGVRAVVLIGGGEPMMHPAIAELILLLSSNNIDIGITTNGLFITKYRDIIANHVKWIRISVDSASDYLFSRVRPSHSGASLFDEVISNIKSLTSLTDRRCTVGYSYCMLPISNGLYSEETNAREILSACLLAKEIGCDYFELKPSFDENHFHYVHSDEEISIASAQFAECQKYADENFSVYGATNTDFMLTSNESVQPKDYDSCPMLDVRTLITPHGIYPCPYFRGKSSHSYGNPQHLSFNEIWSGTVRDSVVKSLKPCTDCQFHCIRHDSNIQLFDFQKKFQDGNSESIDQVEPYNSFV